jgi:Clr5 domain
MYDEAGTRGDSIMERSRSLTPVDDDILLQSPGGSLCVVVNALKKSKGPSTSEWDRVRPIVTHLYVKKALKLEVLSIMAEGHNFVAT